MDEKVIDLYLGLAWELFSEFVLAGYEPAWAIERTEQAMRVWKEHEDRTYQLLAARATQPTPKLEENRTTGTSALETEYPAGPAIGYEIPRGATSQAAVEPALAAQADLPQARQPESQTRPDPVFNFSGRWITRGCHLVSVIATPKALYPYDTGVGSDAPSLGMYWNASGLAVNPETHQPMPEYDLMERAPGPGGRRMDYSPDAIPKDD